MLERLRNRGVPAWAGVVALALLALSLRLLYVSQVSGTALILPEELDPAFYYNWAKEIAGGAWVGSEPFVQSPLYAYLLAFVMLVVGERVGTILLVQAILGCGTVLLTYLVGRRYFDHRRGLIAGVLIALYGPFIFYEGMVMKTFLSPLLTLVLLLALDRARERSRRMEPSPSGSASPPDRPGTERSAGRRVAIDFGLAGAAFALVTLTRDNFVLIGPLLAGLVIILGGGWNRRGFTSAAAFCLGAILLIAPVTLRNRAVSGEFVLLTTGGGEVFYIGNNAEANGLYVPPPFVRPDPQFEHADFVERASDISGRPLTAMQSSWFWFREGLRFIVNEPLQWFGLLWNKQVHFWNAYELPDNLNYAVMQWFSPVLDLLNPEFPPQNMPTIAVPTTRGWLQVRLHLFSTFGTVAPLGLVGLYLTRRRWRPLLPLYVVLFGYIGTVMLFFNFSRFRVPVVPILALFAADTLLALARLVKKQWGLAVAFAGRSGEMMERALALRPTRPRMIAGVLLLVALIGTNIVLPRGVVPAIEQSVMIGNAYYAQGDPVNARQSFFTGLVLLGEAAEGPVEAELLRRHFGAGVTREALREELEIESISRGDQFKGIHIGVHHGMGIALLLEAQQLADRGQRQESRPLIDRAIAQFDEALKLAPAYLLSLRKMAQAYQLLGDTPVAREWLEKGVDLWPSDLRVRLELAELLFLSGDFERSLSQLKEAYRRDPGMAPRDLAQVHFSRGLIYFRMSGHRGEALHHFERALALNPAHSQAAAIQETILKLRSEGVEPLRDPAFDPPAAGAASPGE